MTKKQVMIAVCTALMLSGQAQARPLRWQDTDDYYIPGNTQNQAQNQPSPFNAWLEQFKAEAQQQGISRPLLDQAFAGVMPDERILVLDKKQPEGTVTLNKYLSNVVTPQRITEGRQKLNENRALLEQVAAKYGVQPRFVVALWGIETSYGKVTGGFNIVEALATLAYDGRRAEFFRKELLSALQILQQGHTTIDAFTGSWAGAMGQSQFMPSTFMNHAVDFNGDGHKDIWNTQGDVFASMANYLHQLGWNDQQAWGREVRVPAGFNRSMADLTIKKPLAEWASLGVRKLDGSVLPNEPTLKASLVFPDYSGGDRAFVVYENFDRILQWNRSKYFGVAVGTLADAIGN